MSDRVLNLSMNTSFNAIRKMKKNNVQEHCSSDFEQVVAGITEG